MFCVYVAGDELAPVTHNFRQNFFAITADRCHLGQFDEALAGIPRYLSFSPGRPEFSGPLADQLTLQRPPLLFRRVRHGDPQHNSSSLRRESVERANSNVLPDEFNEPAGSMWQLRSQRSASILDARICLRQRILGADEYPVRTRKATIRGRRFGSSARGPSPQ